MIKKLSYGNAFQTYTSIFALTLVAALVSYLFWNLMMPRMDFYNNLWGPVHLLVQGKSPYETTSLNPILPAIWFPMVIGVFFPLGWLSENLSLQVWFIFNIIELCGIVYLAQGDRRSLFNTIILALLCFFFPFVLNNYNLGQFSITAMLCMMLSSYFADSRRDWLAAFFLALALSKPQLGIVAVFGLSVFYFQRNGFKGVFCFGLQTFTMALLTSLPLFIFYPVWIPDWVRSFQSNHGWLHPSLFSILNHSMGIFGVFIWAAIFILALGVARQLWIKFPPAIAMLWSLGITTIITPYIWSWDFVLLLPIWISTFARADWKRKLFLLTFYGVAWYGMALVQMQQAGDNSLFWWVPLCFIAVLVFVTDWKADWLGGNPTL